MRAWYVLLFPFFFFLFALQCHLVYQDQQAQHPVPLRPITPDPATLCSQGAIHQRVKLDMIHFCAGNLAL